MPREHLPFVSMMDRERGRTTMQRRLFLRRTAFGVAALTVGPWLPGGSPSPDHLPSDIGDRLLFASSGEFVVLQAVAETFIGLTGGVGPLSTAEAASRMDHYLAGADPEVQEQFHQLLTVFNSGITAFLFDLRTSSFVGMSPEDRVSYVQDWMESPIGFRRTAFQGLKRVAMSCYYSHPASFASIGYDDDRSPRYAS